MKKLFVMMLAAMMLAGCAKKEVTSTFMVTRDNKLYALYNQDGKKLTEYSYKTFQEVKGVGYIVTNDKDQKGLISDDGKEIIAMGTYETLEAVDQMLYATKKVAVKNDKKDEKKATKATTLPTNTFIKSNFFVLNKDGEVLYTADEKTGIMKSGLPIIQKDKNYIILNKDGQEFYNDKQVVKYAYQYDSSSSVIVGFENEEKFYHFNSTDEKKNIELTIKEKGTFQFLVQNEVAVVLNDSKLKSMIYVDLEKGNYFLNSIAIKGASFDETGNVMLVGNNKTYIYQQGKTPVLMTSYYLSAQTYVARATDIYGPHHVYKNGKVMGDLENCQLYPEAKHVYSEIFPVYLRDQGYKYYDFDNKKVIDQVFLEAEPFDLNSRAIVKANDNGYSLIDEKGTILTKDAYYKIKYIGSSYYAVYNENGTFGIIDKDAKEVIEKDYTSLPTDVIVKYQEKEYMLLGKNGRTFVYDIEDDLKEIFSHEGNVVLSEKGYFHVDNLYFTFNGEEIN